MHSNFETCAHVWWCRRMLTQGRCQFDLIKKTKRMEMTNTIWERRLLGNINALPFSPWPPTQPSSLGQSGYQRPWEYCYMGPLRGCTKAWWRKIFCALCLLWKPLKMSPSSASKHSFVGGEELLCAPSGMQWIRMLLRSSAHSTGIQDNENRGISQHMKLQAIMSLLELHAILKIHKGASLPCSQMQRHTTSKLRTHELHVSTDFRFGRWTKNTHGIVSKTD